MKRPLMVLVCLLLVTVGSAWPATQTAPLRIFLRGGPKTHGPAGNGLHDGEVWVREWVPLLQARGATVVVVMDNEAMDARSNELFDQINSTGPIG